MSDRITLDPTLDPWERQPRETPKRHARFLAFRDLGLTRTLAKAADELALSYSHVRAMAAEYRWHDRASAWDAHQQRQYAAEMEEERRRAAREDVRVLRIMTGMIGQALPNVQQQAADMTLAEFTRFVDITLKWRRTLFGDPTETIAVTGPGGDPLTVAVEEYAAMPLEQKRVRLAELAATVARRARALGDADDEDDGEETYEPADEDDAEEHEPTPALDEHTEDE
ncbi:hypothetical protein [Streptomyces sp. DH12]|uniref:hypothetical protein n=1 Tax=Streptomyces sp. DH12 TaxID=2857010 RepID=UPI001E4B609B|nr:hypothetical protein [Streptomyces sp. DH12]